MKHSEETKRKISLAKTGKKMPSTTGEKHWAWKGDKVGYYALHDWMVKQVPKPAFCQLCNKIQPDELINISPVVNEKTYNRDPKNWLWSCRICHATSDRRGDRMKRYTAMRRGKPLPPETRRKVSESMKRYRRKQRESRKVTLS